VGKKVKLTLDGKLIEAKPGTTILEAAESEGIFIPTFCSIKELKPQAACYICVVEVEGEDDLVPACSTEVQDRMKINTGNDRVQEARRTCIELLLSDHLGDCMGPCTGGCPAGIDISGFIKYMALGEDRKALELIKQTMPLPAVLGRVCKKPCEDVCRRQLVEEEIAICHLKRFAADIVSDSGNEYIPKTAPSTGKKVAIIGAGPAGLSAAYYLLVLGHKCTIFDENELPGGMLRYGIPAYRLPRNVLDREIDVIKKIGGRFHPNISLGKEITLKELHSEYDAVFIGIGAQSSFSLGVEGENSEGIVSGISFLKTCNSSKASGNIKGKKVIVIGGGDVAMDAARTAIRKGAAEVNVYCLEKSDEMPAGEEEVRDASAEGIKIHNGWGVKKVLTGKGKVTGVEFKRCISVFDDDGKFKPQYNENDNSNDRCEILIVSIGQCIDGSSVSEIKSKPSSFLIADEKTMQTSLENVFAGGDCVSGPDTVVNAVAAGRRAAVSIDQYLGGRAVAGEPLMYNHTMGKLEDVPQKAFERFIKEKKIPMPTLSLEKRIESFDEVEKGFTIEMARAEAKRCMECRCRDAHECRLRSYATMFEAESEKYIRSGREYDLDESHPDIVYEEHKCIKCGLCVRITEELLGTKAMQVVGRGFTLLVKPNPGGKMALVNGEGIERIVENCPVGALTMKKDITAVADYIMKRTE